MNRKGFLGSIILVAILLAIGFFWFVGKYNSEEKNTVEKNISDIGIKDSSLSKNECEFDSDCVPSTCCHPNKCVVKNSAPKCSGVFCTMNCEHGTLDCGQGSCRCIAGKCGGVFK